jgi:hypothetical protein
MPMGLVIVQDGAGFANSSCPRHLRQQGWCARRMTAWPQRSDAITPYFSGIQSGKGVNAADLDHADDEVASLMASRRSRLRNCQSRSPLPYAKASAAAWLDAVHQRILRPAGVPTCRWQRLGKTMLPP